MPALKYVRIESAPDDNGRTHVIKSNGGTLRFMFMGQGGSMIDSPGTDGAFRITAFDNATEASGSIITTLTMHSNAADAVLPMAVDFQNGLTLFIRSGAGGALTVVYD